MCGGAFTDAKADRTGRFELADGGTLFLDEIANMSLNQQNRLLRVLETGEFERVGSSKTRRADVRLLSATNADLQNEVAAGRFRQDLFLSLEYGDHSPCPASAIAARTFAVGRPLPEKTTPAISQDDYRFEPAAIEALARYSWPGNVRELSHCRRTRCPDVRRLDHTSSRSRLEPAATGSNAGRGDEPRRGGTIPHQKNARALQRNALRAAEALGLSRSAFYRRLEKYRL